MSGPYSVAPASSGVASAAAVAPKQGFRFRPRHLWIVPGLAIAIVGSRTDPSLTGIGVMVAFGLAPHLSFLAGIGQRRPAGGMAPRALAVFNAMHHPAIPPAIVALSLTGVIPTLLFVGATAWLSHIVLGWGIGDGIRSATPHDRSARA
jgi:hypothetical protein